MSTCGYPLGYSGSKALCTRDKQVRVVARYSDGEEMRLNYCGQHAKKVLELEWPPLYSTKTLRVEYPVSAKREP